MNVLRSPWLARGGVPLAGVLVSVGVALQLPDYAASASVGFRMSAMGMSPLMGAGMAVAATGVLIGFAAVIAVAQSPAPPVEVRVETLDDRTLNSLDVTLLAVLGIGLLIDVMKPATISFVIPGARREYGLSMLQVSAWPLVALTGTVAGSVLWGWLGDRAGRRPAVLLAALLFVATSMCGAMPAYWLNLVMCLFMGMSAGGFLPMVYALVAEIVPRHHRGWILVTLGCIGGAGGYLAASLAAALLESHFGWRVLWLIGLPTGALMLLLARFVPESPRFLFARGREAEARRQMERLGARVELVPASKEAARSSGGAGLLTGRRRGDTIVMAAFAISWGVVNFGLLTWVPTLLRAAGGSVAHWNWLLASAALIALPGSLLAPFLFGRWRTRASLGLFSALIVVPLIGIGLVPTADLDSVLFGILLVALLSGLTGTNAMLITYATEVYPTRVRGSGAGMVAAASKVGGIIGPQAVGAIVAASTGFRAAAWTVAVPLAITALLLVARGRETRGVGLEALARTAVERTGAG